MVNGGTLSRRHFFAAVGAGSTAGLVLAGSGTAAAAGFSATPAQRLAMHLHGSWSEGAGSWEGQFAEASATQIGVLYMTDHDHRALATSYLTSLEGALWQSATTGTTRTAVLTAGSSGNLRLAVESATSSPASGTLRVTDACASSVLRTSISGLRLDHAFGSCTLASGARYEIRIDLSYHAAGLSRPAGKYALVYRFGGTSSGRSLEGGGLVGVVRARLPASGTTVVLAPETDVAALWPTMWAADNVLFGLSFTVTSPSTGGKGDVAVSSCAFRRTRSNPAAVSADQAALIGQYGPRYPGVRARASTEIGRSAAHITPFGIPQLFPDYALDTPTDHDAFYADVVGQIHAAGGVVSLNHPFGSSSGTPVSATEQTQLRRATYASLAAPRLYGVDILEAGYAQRGSVDFATHLALWDTFSRNGVFLTGNGASDDHTGQRWTTLKNGFFTGVWAQNADDSSLVPALRSGRAFFALLGAWPSASLDLVLDDAVRLGSVLVSTASTHRLGIASSALPAGATLEVVRGPADLSGAVDPGTSVAAALTAGDLASGVASVTVSTTVSRFFRVQVRDSAGVLIASSNPVWVLRTSPSGGVPPSRRP